MERRKTILVRWPRVLTRLVGRSRAIFGLEVGSRCVNRAEEMDWSEPVAELYETCLENSMVGRPTFALEDGSLSLPYPLSM